MMRKTFKIISMLMILMIGLNLFPNALFNFSVIANASESDTSWEVIDYSTMTDTKLSVEDFALMHEDNWLNNYVANKTNKTVETLSLSDFLGMNGVSCSNSALTTIPESIKFMSNLTILKLNYNNISVLPKYIGNLKKLTYLELFQNQLTILPDSIGNLINLKVLSCDFNQITELPDSIGDLKNLKEATFVENRLTSIPSSIGNLINLTNLYIGSNKIISLPDSIGDLKTLKMFDCSYNQLTSLPNSIGNLTEITTLWCNNNLLTNIPDFISNLTNLTDFTFDIVIEESKAIASSSMMTKYQITPTDVEMIDSEGKTLKAGSTSVSFKLNDATTISIPIVITSLPKGDSLSINFNQADTLEVKLSTNTIDFGTTNEKDTSLTNELILSIKSSLSYDIDIMAIGNFENKEDATRIIPITKLGVKVDNQTEYSKFEGTNTPKHLISNVPNTSGLTDVTRIHTVRFELSETIGYKAGSYEVPIVITVTQQ